MFSSFVELFWALIVVVGVFCFDEEFCAIVFDDVGMFSFVRLFFCAIAFDDVGMSQNPLGWLLSNTNTTLVLVSRSRTNILALSVKD